MVPSTQGKNKMKKKIDSAKKEIRLVGLEPFCVDYQNALAIAT